jgi:membrane protein implicated in regulation of membrane protease activity
VQLSPSLVQMTDPGFKISLIFFALAVIFLVVSGRDYVRNKGKTNSARQTWLRVSLIFAAVGIVLALMHK